MDAVTALGESRGRWILSERYRLLYCPITKVANTSFRVWFLELEGLWRPEYEHTDDLTSVSLPIRLSRYDPDEVAAIANTYFRFAFVRNPFTRLASSFVNKFVDRKPKRLRAAQKVEEAIRGGLIPRLPLPSRMKRKAIRHRVKKGITFREFVEFLVRTDSSELDNHWAPQFEFVDGVDLDFLGRFESLEADVARLEAALDERGDPRPPPIDLPHRNRSEYAPSGGTFVGDVTTTVLRRMTLRPHVSQFYDREIEEMVAERFREDFERYGYSTTLT